MMDKKQPSRLGAIDSGVGVLTVLNGSRFSPHEDFILTLVIDGNGRPMAIPAVPGMIIEFVDMTRHLTLFMCISIGITLNKVVACNTIITGQALPGKSAHQTVNGMTFRYRYGLARIH